MTWAAHLAAADRAVFQHLGGPVVYASSSGETAELRGVFDKAYVRVDAGDPGVSSAGPAVFLRVAELPSDPVVDDATVTVDGVSYAVREAQPDGQGGVLLLLHERF